MWMRLEDFTEKFKIGLLCTSNPAAWAACRSEAYLTSNMTDWLFLDIFQPKNFQNDCENKHKFGLGGGGGLLPPYRRFDKICNLIEFKILGFIILVRQRHNAYNNPYCQSFL